MQTITTKLKTLLRFSSSAVNINNGGVVTSSTHNLTINHNNIINFILNAFSRMSNKSLKNSYAALDYKPIQI
jgi:hypothetical protein